MEICKMHQTIEVSQ